MAIPVNQLGHGAVSVTRFRFVLQGFFTTNTAKGTRKRPFMNQDMMKLAIRQITDACENGGTISLSIDRETYNALYPELSRIRAAKRAAIDITGQPGAYRVTVRPLARLAPVDKRGRKVGVERQKMEALTPGECVTFALEGKSLDSINQKIHAVQRANPGLKLKRAYDKASNTVTVTRTDGVDFAPEAARRATKYNVLRDMQPGDVIFVEDRSTIAQVRSACAYHNQARKDVVLRPIESAYDDAIEVHCMPVDGKSSETVKARRAIKKRLIDRVFIKEGVILPDGSTPGSTDGSTYEGCEFYNCQIDDILDILPPGQTIKVGGTPEAAIKQRAKLWAEIRGLHTVVEGKTVRFE